MLFNSKIFIVFFFAVYPVYILLWSRHRAQNAWLLLASLVFYGAWDWRFLVLMAVSTGVDYHMALRIRAASDQHQKKRYLLISIVLNLVILGFFKYFNFFADSAVALLSVFGISAGHQTLSIALPVGISFYTFQAISYVVDVYRGDIEPVRSRLDYGLFIAFFPHLVAGPIQRPSILLPQVQKIRSFSWSQGYAGILLIAGGFFKKVVIADNLAKIANPIFDNHTAYSGLDLVIGATAFTFQIYGDFSGYSDIARGLSKLMGFDLLINFKLPYFALNPSDFWRRWHISLSTWLRDYLYIGLGGNRKGSLFTYRNLFLTMLLGGFWHGAAWNFVAWGAYHGAILVIYRLIDRSGGTERDRDGAPGRVGDPARRLLMFVLVLIGWIIFRSRTLGQAGYMIGHLGLAPSPASADLALQLAFFVIPILAIQFWQHRKRDLLAPIHLPAWVIAPALGLLLILISVFGVRESMEFIYFQF